VTTEKGGVPLTYTQELGEEICIKIATSDYGLKRLCAENPHWPSRKCILEWRIKIKSFGDMYEKAKKDQVETLIDDCLDIADDTSHDTLIRTNKDGDEYEVCNSEWINRSRLRIDTRKFLAQKLAPKLYGDRVLEEKQDKLQDDLNEIRETVQKCMKPIP
jgi:hypothetical protein